MLDAILSIAPDDWDRFVAACPNGHILQTTPWGTLKSRFGWSAERVGLACEGKLVAGAQVLYRRLPAALGRLAYVPKGPIVTWEDETQVKTLVAVLDRAARAQGAIALTIEPDLPNGDAHDKRLQALGFGPSPLDSVQPRRTIVVDIAPDEEAVLGAMKQKTRYNVRLAARKGVTVREATEADLPAFHALMAATGERDAFGVHTPAYYETAYHLFAPRGWARLLLAEAEEEAVAAVMVFALPPRSWYFYGASSDAHREKMPTYLLQWEAMRWAKSLGCTTYDLYGVPDEDEEKLEAQFMQRSDNLWGVYRFKRGFGGKLVRSAGAWDRVYAPVRYRLYRMALSMRRPR
ncbi:MAG: peptidoglycan bridge formation glycyltransferase FemA/FemB family protein [Anaerolineae bacterium]|nr:peptidoglycan bridge formation glycyltransferase FemA/FemB family protein [Anaerolineae bacterium]